MSSARRRKKQAAQAAKKVGRVRSLTPIGDLFGLNREQRIIESNVRNVFTPHQPISQINLLFGRQTEVQMLIETLNTPGQHVLLYGERGVGKSSLANVVHQVISIALQQSRIYVKRCDRSDVFETILQEPLAEVGAELELTHVTDLDSTAKKGEIKLSLFGLGGERKRDVSRTFTSYKAISPSTAAAALHELDGLLVIDEFDAIASTDDRRKIAELIKQLSDAGSRFKIMVVGIAETGDELTAAHPSVQRCLRETKLRRMKDSELEEIVTAGADALGLKFDAETTSAIVKLSAGYPHFTHLLALKCAEDAIAEGRPVIHKTHLVVAMKRAVSDAEGTLKRIYDDSTRSVSSMYRQILAAAASLDGDEFTSAELREAIEKKIGEGISQGSLNNYFQRLMSDDGSKILRRAGKGMYRFEDPRMRSYVRIVNRIT